MIQQPRRIIGALLDNISKVIIGKEEAVEYALIALLCGGHVLIEDVPGVGKTTLASALAKSLACTFRRIQFTPDLMPSDVTGFTLVNFKTGEMEFKEGAVMAQVVLADEINRTSPKTQSALLEVMEEGSVTVDGVTRPVPQPFFVIATENPLGSTGTQMLPESQLDRFMICTAMGYPEAADEIRILQEQALDHLNYYRPTEIIEIAKNPRSEEYKKISTYIARIEHFCVGVNQKIYDSETVYALARDYLDGAIKTRIEPIIDRKNQYGDDDYYENIHQVYDWMAKRKEKRERKLK